MREIIVLSEEQLEALREALKEAKRISGDQWDTIAYKMGVGSDFTVKNFCRSRTKKIDYRLVKGAIFYLLNHQNAFVRTTLEKRYPWIWSNEPKGDTNVRQLASQEFSTDPSVLTKFTDRYVGKFLSVRCTEADENLVFIMLIRIYKPFSTPIPTYRNIYLRDDGRKTFGSGIIGPISETAVFLQGYVADETQRLRRTAYLEPYRSNSLQGIICGTKPVKGQIFSRIALLKIPYEAEVEEVFRITGSRTHFPWNDANKICPGFSKDYEQIVEEIANGPRYFSATAIY